MRVCVCVCCLTGVCVCVCVLPDWCVCVWGGGGGGGLRALRVFPLVLFIRIGRCHVIHQDRDKFTRTPCSYVHVTSLSERQLTPLFLIQTHKRLKRALFIMTTPPPPPHTHTPFFFLFFLSYKTTLKKQLSGGK